MAKRDYTPHEGLFQKVFRAPENTRHFLKKHLDEDIQRHIDLSTLYLENTTYLDDDLKKHFSDLVFSVMLEGEEFPTAKVYLLFEHKGAPESLVGMQVLRYMALQWQDLYNQGKVAGGKLPPILPIVIYHGQDKWGIRTSFQDLVELPSESFRAYIPHFAFAFFNVKGVDAEKVQENVILKFYVEMIKQQNTPGIKEFPMRFTRGILESLERRTALEYIEIFFKYLTKATDTVTKEDYQKALDMIPEGGENIMNTLADQWIQQGREEILQEKGKWMEQAELKATQETLIDVATEQYGPLPAMLETKIKTIKSATTLKNLARQAVKLESFDDFTQSVKRVTEN